MKKLSLLLAVAVCALASAAVASAGNVPSTLSVSGTPGISTSLPSSLAFGSLTISGGDMTTLGDLAINVVDDRGTGAGWHTTITSTQWTNGTQTLDVNATSITGVAEACHSGYTCTDPTNAITYPLVIPAGATAPAAVSMYDAALNSGMGSFDLTFHESLAFPANGYAGSYTSTQTIASTTGP